MKPYAVLAFDFGASSGRAIKGVLKDSELSFHEIHRFENTPINQDGTLFWDIDDLFTQVLIGIEKAGEFDSIGFDTWGVDFGLLDENGKLLQRPVHYRDTRTNGIVEEVCAHIDAAELYKKTGNQIMPINTLFQLMALRKKNPELLEQAKTLLFMPDLFAYQLTGKPCCEKSIASTSQMLNPNTCNWDKDVLETLSLRQELFLPVISSGSVVGLYNGKKVIAVAGHDTQCAVAALPTRENNVAFLSCGTWSLLGTELDDAILTKESQQLCLSNEIGANGKINYLKNIIGLWLIQESRREWKRQGKTYSFAELEQEALTATPFQCFIDPDDPIFSIPGDIPERVCTFCKETGQIVPQTVGEIMRCIYESLALKYRFVLQQLTTITKTNFKVLHILGGGTQAHLLCQITANSCNLPVIAGPIEATALGNIIIQLTALGALKNVDEGRDLIAKAETLHRYEPMDTVAWNTAYEVFKKIIV